MPTPATLPHRPGLEHLSTQVYNDGQTRYGNWYSWQIGAPQAL
ncbi:hypothetical protein ABZ943_37430, partial [Streptomyces rubiginosohelvolus]